MLSPGFQPASKAQKRNRCAASDAPWRIHPFICEKKCAGPRAWKEKNEMKVKRRRLARRRLFKPKTSHLCLKDFLKLTEVLEPILIVSMIQYYIHIMIDFASCSTPLEFHLKRNSWIARISWSSLLFKKIQLFGYFQSACQSNLNKNIADITHVATHLCLIWFRLQI